jgi:undecaprenyl pyrophosphate phosphatase UppP
VSASTDYYPLVSFFHVIILAIVQVLTELLPLAASAVAMLHYAGY